MELSASKTSRSPVSREDIWTLVSSKDIFPVGTADAPNPFQVGVSESP